MEQSFQQKFLKLLADNDEMMDQLQDVVFDFWSSSKENPEQIEFIVSDELGSSKRTFDVLFIDDFNTSHYDGVTQFDRVFSVNGHHFIVAMSKDSWEGIHKDEFEPKEAREIKVVSYEAVE